MAGNAYNLTILSVYTDFTSIPYNNNWTITIQVPEIATIKADMVKIYRLHNGGIFVPVGTTLITSPAPIDTQAVIDLSPYATPTDPLAVNDVYLIQIVNGTNVSNMVAIDLASNLDAATHNGLLLYLMPNQPGDYQLKVSQVCGENFPVDGDSCTVGPRPVESSSSIHIEKPYLVKFSNQLYPITITLDNPSHDAVTGFYEVVYVAQKL